MLVPDPLKAGSSAWTSEKVRQKLERRLEEVGRALAKELDRVRNDERRRVTSQVAVDMICAEQAICRALLASALGAQAEAAATLEKLSAHPLPPQAEVRDLERYQEQWARTCAQLARELELTPG